MAMATSRPFFLDRFGPWDLTDFWNPADSEKQKKLIQQKSNFWKFSRRSINKCWSQVGQSNSPKKNWGHVGFPQKGHIAMDHGSRSPCWSRCFSSPR